MKSNLSEIAKEAQNECVLVRFNCTTLVHMIPDDQYEQEKETLKKMRFQDFKNYQQRLAAGSPFEIKSFNIGDEALVPNWYFKAHKKDMVPISVHNGRFKTKSGHIRPFDGEEAVMHGYVEKATETMKKVLRFEKVTNKMEKEVA